MCDFFCGVLLEIVMMKVLGDVRCEDVPPSIDFTAFDSELCKEKRWSVNEIKKRKKECGRNLDCALTDYGCFFACFEGFSNKDKLECFKVMKNFFKNDARLMHSHSKRPWVSRFCSGKCGKILWKPTCP